MPELTAILEAKVDADTDQKRFLAAIQGIDLDKESEQDSAKIFEDMKARVFSRGAATSSDDIVSLQGRNAQMAGFGIGMGIEYAKETPKNPLG